MAHQRGLSTADSAKEPHSVSLKVLRLSRPSLSVQHPLPTPSPSPSDSPATYPIPSASLAYPSPNPSAFILSPLLTLPPAFGSAYVGETFSCTLCANNELLPSSSPSKEISNVRIDAEMKIPSSSVPIRLVLGPEPTSPTSHATETEMEKEGVDLDPSQSLQKLVSFDLKEEGSHVLAVTVTYTESTPTHTSTPAPTSPAPSSRIRTFRKLYQFVCKGCMVVRTKTGALPSFGAGRKWALEAQLENCGDETIVLDMVVLETGAGFRSQGVNWEVVGEGGEMERPVLMPGDVQQVCFLVQEVLGEDGRGIVEPVDGRLVFGILSLSWRGPMGNRGFLSTGSLGAKLK